MILGEAAAAGPADAGDAGGFALQGLVKRFPLRGRRPVTALDRVSFASRRGAVVAVLGPSGCGKTTLLRICADLDAPSEGRVLLHGAAPRRLREAGRLGVAFQDAALLPWRSVAANIRLPLDLAGRAGGAGRVADLVALVGLRGFEAALPFQLSGGLRQRVSLARALALSPDVLLLDEPFGALDALTRRRLNLDLQGVWSGRTVSTLLVTHSVVEAALMADTVVVLHGCPGRLAAVVEVALPRPRTAALLASPEFRAVCDAVDAVLARHDPNADA